MERRTCVGRGAVSAAAKPDGQQLSACFLLSCSLLDPAWLLLLDRRAGLEFLLWGMAFALSGLVAFQLGFGTSLLGQLASPRLSSFANLANAVSHLWWMILPGVAIAGLWPDRSALLCTL